MSRSPRKLLKRALEPLDEMAQLFERYPEAKQELEAKIGVECFAGVGSARDAIRQAIEILDSAAPKHDSYDCRVAAPDAGHRAAVAVPKAIAYDWQP